MSEPEFDRDGYPTDATLEIIKNWPINVTNDMELAMDYVGRAWNYPEYWMKDPAFIDPEWPNHPPELRYVFSTGGWSGNESLVHAIEQNQMLQALGAWSWRRGGHYEYRFPRFE